MASSQILVSGVSGRYATALFELAVDAKALDAIESDMQTLRAALSESADLRALVSSPLVKRADQAKAVTALGQALSLNDLTGKFLGTLASNRRLVHLEKILSDMARLLAAHRGELTATVTSAIELTKTQTEALRKALKAAMGRDVAMTVKTDESLLGGLVVQMGSKMIDSSLKTKLNTLSVAMKGVQ